MVSFLHCAEGFDGSGLEAALLHDPGKCESPASSGSSELPGISYRRITRSGLTIHLSNAHMKAVYRASCYFGRMGNLSGVFIADTEDMKMLKDTNPTLCFGDVLGKHSDITTTFNEWDLEEFRDAAAVSVVERLGLQNGIDLWDAYMMSPVESQSSSGEVCSRCSGSSSEC